MDPNMKSNIVAIKALEDKYGLELFWMSAIHLFDVGMNIMRDKTAVEKEISAIMEQDKADSTNGKITVMSPNFKCAILECAAELAMFSPLTVFAYVKAYLVISNYTDK